MLMHYITGFWNNSWNIIHGSQLEKFRNNHTSLMAVVTPSDCVKSVRNRYIVETVGGFFVLSLDFWFFDDIGAFVKGLSQISSFIFYCLCWNKNIHL